MMKRIHVRYAVLLMIALLSTMSMPSKVYAEVSGPGWFISTGEPVRVEEAGSYYAGQAAREKSLVSSTLSAPLTAGATTITPEISELARALQHDPKLIYEYVHNYIDYVPYYGSLKGATLTLLDGSGNDFDQAALMIALLRESGYTARFVHGIMTIGGEQLLNWVGVEANAADVFVSGGVPFNVGFRVLKVDRVWVKVRIEGTDYLFDPALKAYEYTGKIDLAQATQYDRTDLLAEVSVGASEGSDFIQNVNEANLNNKLVEYANNLVNTIRNEHPNSEVKDIIGGRRIIPENLDQFQTSLPLPTTIIEIWDDIPAAFTATLRIEHVGIDHTFMIPEMGGQRLTVTYAGTNSQPELRLDGELISVGNGTSPGSQYDLTLSIDHPYAAGGGSLADQRVTHNVISGATYAIVSGFGTTDTLINQRQRVLDENLHAGLAETSEGVRGEALNIMGLTWMKEIFLAERLITELAETVAFRHHTIGVMAQEGGYYIDVKASFASHNSRDGLEENKRAHFNAFGTIASAFEHGILEQLMGSEVPGISTMKILQIANKEGHKVFWANSSNFGTIRPQLQNYSNAELNDFQSQVNQGRILILPDNGELGIDQWRGLGYISKANNSLGLIIGGGYFGGFVSRQANVQSQRVVNFNQVTLFDVARNVALPTPKARDPVDMATGAFLQEGTDLSLGEEAPLGLAFSRSYNSSNNLKQKTLGYGWSHNYEIELMPVSDGNPGLGLRQPVDAAALITELYIVVDLMKNEDNLKGWMIASLANKWAVDQLIDNAITVQLGGQMMKYIQLADGTYAPPPGITTQLIDNGDSTFRLQERFGTQMDFDINNMITQLTDVDGNALTFTYTGEKLTEVKDAFNRTLTLNYTGENLTSVSDSTGRSVSYGYDSNDNLRSVTDVAGKVWGFGYDNLHQMTSLSNPLGITTATNTYDSQGRVDTQTVPRQGEGVSATYNFYFSGFRNVEEDPFGRQTIYHLDEKGRTFAIENELGHKNVTTFDGQNHEVGVTDPRGNTTTFEYDGNHNLTKIINALTHETVNTYDGQFRLIKTEDPLTHVTQFVYDTEHHLTQTTDAETNTTQLSYFPNGQTQTTTDGRSTVTTLTYDSLGHPQTSQTGSQPSVNSTYDAIGRLTNLTDQVGSSTSFMYDDRGLLLTRTDALGKAATFVYDDAGQLISVTDRNNETVTYNYTPTGSLESIVFPDLSSINFTYDLHDNLLQMQDPLGLTTYGYDEVYRLTSSTAPHGFSVGYEYDESGNVTKLIYPDNKEVVYTYDELNRIKTVTNWLNQTATYVYDSAGRLTSLINFNGTVTTYGYDKADRLTSLENRRTDNSGIATYAYTLDPNGNRTQIIKDEPLVPSVNTPLSTFSYNPEKNRLLSGGGSSFTYDNEGQLASKDTDMYTFDFEHRLTGITGSTSSQFSYDGQGNRLQTVRDGVTTRYIYDAAGNLLAEADENNTITQYYIHGAGLLGMVTSGNETYTYHYNGNGNTVVLTDSSQQIVNSYGYSPYGIVLSENETIAQPFKYVGQFGIMSEPNGLYYMRARYYNSEVGRFISEDPIGFGGGQVNLYAYVGGNPINFVDPLGLEAVGGCRCRGGLDTFTAISLGLGVGAVLPKAVRGALGAGRILNDALGAKGPSINRDVILSGGRSGQNVKDLVGPSNSVVRGGGERAFLTNNQGQVIADITRNRVKPVIPGQGFGAKRPPTAQELKFLDQLFN